MILLIDDEEIVRDVGGELLELLGFSTLTAGSGEVALDLLTKRSTQIHLVILDMVMPRMSGPEIFVALRRIKPDLKVLLSSGYGLDTQIQDLLDAGAAGFIQKPFNMKELSDTIARILD